MQFAHPSEQEFARFLDYYRIRWQYEPVSFPIAWEDTRVAEMFTPDFYLPEHDLYIELTTMKQSLVTPKNRKLRLLRELYPELHVRLAATISSFWPRRVMARSRSSICARKTSGRS